MGKDLYESSALAKGLFEKQNGIPYYRHYVWILLEELKETKVTQPAVFTALSYVAKKTLEDFPEMVAGHSLGTFSIGC
jgi:[acyl-carrier-protein] S-malonyltransferase